MAPQPPRRLDQHPTPGRRRWRTAARALLLGGALCACDQVRRLPHRFLDNRTPRERYEAGLAEAGLGGSALVRDWLAAGERALTEAPVVSLLHQEEGFLDPATPAAFGYRLRVERGQEASLTMAIAGDYVLRAQPELLRGGRFTITIRVAPTMAVPVLRGRDTDIGGHFGAPRDGGSRLHYGIDIFARRGTPALAAGDAVVSRVDSSGLGGLVVWLRDRRGNRLYYAHLDSQLVQEGARVSAGDTVGLVGRTGNARTTPAHLHFGVYRRGEGPVDPLWFVRRVNGTVPRLAADTTLIGGWGRTRRPLVVTAAPDARAAARESLPRDTPVLVLAAVGRWYRVRTPEGGSGYLPAARVQHAGAGAARLRVDRETAVARQPGGDGDPADGVALLAAGDTVVVLGQAGASLLIRTPRGRSGWIRQAPTASAAVD